MKTRITILFLVFSMLFVFTGCGKWWNDFRRPKPRNQSTSIMQTSVSSVFSGAVEGAVVGSSFNQ